MKKNRVQNIIDDYNRDMLAMELDFSLPALRIILVLEVLKEFQRLPIMIRIDTVRNLFTSTLRVVQETFHDSMRYRAHSIYQNAIR